MKKISERTIEQLRGISPDELAAHGVISPAPNQRGKTGWICPLCGSGEGRNHHGRGDGAGSFDEANRFFCHACCNELIGRHKLSAIDLFSIARGLQNENFAEQCRQMANEFNVTIDFDELPDLPRRTRRRNKKFNAKIEPPIDSAELERIQQDLSASDEKLVDFFKFCPNGTWRGLPLELLKKHGVKFNSKWTLPTIRLQKKFATATARMLIPFDGKRGYLARLTCSVDDFDEDAQKYIKPKQNAGTVSLFNTDALNATEPIFCVESAIDALSIEFAGFKVCALNGRGNGNLLVDAVATKEKKPRIVILLDADDAGRKAAPKLHDDLINVGCPCVVRFLSDEVSKIDANEILTTSGVDVLRGKLQSIVDDSISELAAVGAELAKRHDEKINDDDLNFFFEGKSSDLQFAYRLERFCGNRVRWLDDERWIVFNAGVWKRLSEKNSAVSTFGRQLADTMSRYAETKDERELAEKFQSAKKIGCAIGLLKSVDSIKITTDDLNQHNELLNCLNGVVNLQDGKLYPHAPELLLTQQCRADFDANANSPLVDNFFRDIQPDEQTRAGLLRWLGYCLTGETSAEKFMVWHGGGCNGKGVLSKTLLYLFGDYGTGLAPRALLKSYCPTDANAATTGLNALESVRFAISEELTADAELDSSLVKNLTGGDAVNLRRNYGEYRTIENHAKLNISGNYLPKIENTGDEGILRRMLTMPFNVKFGTPNNPADETLKKKMLLPENLRGLLSLLVREAVAWYRGDDGGLIVSPQMMNERDMLLEQSNFVADFINDFYIRVPNASVKAKDFLDELKHEYPRECSRFKRADLIKLVERAGVIYGEGSSGHTREFKGIGKNAATSDNDFHGEPISSQDYNPYD